MINESGQTHGQRKSYESSNLKSFKAFIHKLTLQIISFLFSVIFLLIPCYEATL